MATVKDIRKRISSVKNTQKITRAMKLVAAAKLRRSQQALLAARPYASHMEKLVGHLAALEGEHGAHPLLIAREEVKTIKLVVLTSDRGFCGGFNGTLLRQVVQWLTEKEKSGDKSIQLNIIGRKGRDFFGSRDRELKNFETGLYENFAMGDARQRAEQLVAEYEAGDWDECYYVFNRFKSAMTQDVTFHRVVPITAELAEEETAGEYIPDYIYEPAAPQLLGELIPRYLATDIYRIFLESIASEFGARMVAMDSATNNCSDLIESLTLKANRLRQAAITNELMDIVNGAEALK